MWETLNTVGHVLLNNQALFLKAREECKVLDLKTNNL